MHRRARMQLIATAFLLWLVIFCKKVKFEIITDKNNCLTQDEIRFKPSWTKIYQRKYALSDIGSDLLKSLKIFQHGGNLQKNRFVTTSVFNCVGVVSRPLEKYVPNPQYHQYLDTICTKSGNHVVCYFQDRFMSTVKIKSELSSIYDQGISISMQDKKLFTISAKN